MATPKKLTGPTQTAQISDLVSLIRDLTTQQNKVLEQAMEAQKAQADVLKSWMAMFTPHAPSTSTNELDREAIRNNAAIEDWEPMDAELTNLFSLPKV